MKKILVLIILLLLASTFQNGKALNVPGKTADQSCTTFGVIAGSTSQVGGQFQIFSPTMDKIDAVAVLVQAKQGTTAGVTAVVNQLFLDGRPPRFIGEGQTMNITDHPSWNVFDFEDVSVEPGIYSIHVRTPSARDEALWLAKEDGNCHPNGYAQFDGERREDVDFNFVVYGVNEEEPAPVDPPADPPANPPADPPAADPPANNPPADNTTQPEKPNNTSGTTATSAPSAPDETSPKSSPEEPPTATTTATPPPGDLTKTNKQSEEAKELMSNEELQEILSSALADYNANRAKGIFGIGGIVGAILTWTNIGIFFGIIIFFIILKLILARKKKTQNVENQKV